MSHGLTRVGTGEPPWIPGGVTRLFAATALGVAGSACALGWIVSSRGDVRLATALAVSVCAIGIGAISRTYLLVALVAWLAMLGAARRIISTIDPATGGDPLLLVGPLAFGALVVFAWGAGAFSEHTRLSKAVLAFTAIAALGAVNPLQGGLAVGLSGLLFVVVPTAGFWIGRSFGRDALTAALALVAALSLLGAAYGLTQAFNGFPSWDERWVETTEYASLYVDDFVRPFSSFSGAAEYAFFLGCGLVTWLAFGSVARRVPVTIAAVALLSVSLWLAGIRTVIVTVVAAVALMIAAHRGWTFRSAILGVIGLTLVLSVVVGVLAPGPGGGGGGAAGALAQRQASGLSNPFDSESSTLGLHIALVRDGLLSAISEPLGHGTGSVTVAADRFGSGTRNTEGDPSNAAVAMGLPGLVAFLAVFVLGYRRVYSLARLRGDPLALAAVGILTVTLFQWTNGGQYAVAFLPWLVLGWADEKASRPR